MPFFEKFLGTKEKVRRRTDLLERAKILFPHGCPVRIRHNGKIEEGWAVMEIKSSERPNNEGEPIAFVDKEEDGGVFREEEIPVEELMELNQ